MALHSLKYRLLAWFHSECRDKEIEFQAEYRIVAKRGWEVLGRLVMAREDLILARQEDEKRLRLARITLEMAQEVICTAKCIEPNHCPECSGTSEVIEVLDLPWKHEITRITYATKET